MKKVGLELVCTAVVLSAGAVDERAGTSSAPDGIKINGEFNLR